MLKSRDFDGLGLGLGLEGSGLVNIPGITTILHILKFDKPKNLECSPMLQNKSTCPS